MGLTKIELGVGAFGGVIGLLTCLAVLPSHLLPPPFGLRTTHLEPEDIVAETAETAPAKATLSSRRVPYFAPDLRVARRLEYSSGVNLSPEVIAAARQPKLVRGLMEESLAPLLEWNIDNLRFAFEGWALVRVKAQWHSPVFKLSSEEGKELYDTFDGLPMDTFMDSVADSDAPYCYYSAPLSDWSFVGAFQQAARGWRSLEIKDPVVASVLGVSGRKEGSDGGSAYEAVAVLWLSQPGVTAHAHFDKSHNFLVQIMGRKRVLLWSPKQWRAQYPFDESSIHRHQSQVDFDAPDLIRYPLHETLEATEVILEPGDALYIPPYWWHRIETLGESSGTALSLSVVSPSAEEVTLAQALWHPLPFLAFNATEVATYLPVTLMHAVSGGPADEKQLSTTVKAVAMQAFLAHLLSRLGVPPRVLAETMRATKYDPGILQLDDPSLGLAFDDLLRTGRPPFDAAAAEHAGRVCVAGVAGAAVGPGVLQARKEHSALQAKLPKRAIAAAADEVAALLKHVQDNTYAREEGQQGGARAGRRAAEGAGVVELWLAEYADALARWALGLPNTVGASASADALDHLISACLGELDVLPPEAIVPQDKWEEGPAVLKVGEDDVVQGD